MSTDPLLRVRALCVTFETQRGPFLAVDRFDLTIVAGEAVSLVGESGSGKSVSMLAIMGLLGPSARVTADEISFQGQDLLRLSPSRRRSLIGRDLAMVFQDPIASLNPCFPIGWQIAESLAVHKTVSRRDRRARVIELLEQVGIPSPETRLRAFPHQLSGGMNQRVMIAMAIACNPKLLIADEPTTALDVTIQRQILSLLSRLQQQRGMAMLMVTHDMGVVAQTTSRTQVMYAGQGVEAAPVRALLGTPAHPYTAALLNAIPERAEGRRRLETIPGMVPGVGDRPQGCLFNPRCAHADQRCRVEQPQLTDHDGRRVRCHYPLLGGEA